MKCDITTNRRGKMMKSFVEKWGLIVYGAGAWLTALYIWETGLFDETRGGAGVPIAFCTLGWPVFWIIETARLAAG